MNYIPTIREFVINNYLFGEDNGLREDDSFLDKGIVDSTGVLELVSFLEETYSISIEDEELVPENLDTLENIARYLDRKLGAASVSSE